MITTFAIEGLIEIVKKNRDDHRAIFLEAVEGYKDQGVKLLQEHIERIVKGDLRAVSVHLPRPEDHTHDYDRVIQMLEMSQDTEIELDESDFAQYVMDDWMWKRQFLTTNSAYSMTATRQLQEG